MACLDFSRGANRPAATRASGLGRLASTSSFTIDAVEPGDGLTLREGACTVVMMLEGSGDITCCQGDYDTVSLSKGGTVVVPAACAQTARLRGGAGARALLVRLGM